MLQTILNMNPHYKGHLERVDTMLVPSQGTSADDLKALGIKTEPIERSNLVSAKFPEGWMRKCGPRGEWLFPTELVGPGGAGLIVEYEDNNTVVIPA